MNTRERKRKKERVCVFVFVCVWERERERESVCVWVSECMWENGQTDRQTNGQTKKFRTFVFMLPPSPHCTLYPLRLLFSIPLLLKSPAANAHGWWAPSDLYSNLRCSRYRHPFFLSAISQVWNDMMGNLPEMQMIQFYMLKKRGYRIGLLWSFWILAWTCFLIYSSSIFYLYYSPLMSLHWHHSWMQHVHWWRLTSKNLQGLPTPCRDPRIDRSKQYPERTHG